MDPNSVNVNAFHCDHIQTGFLFPIALERAEWDVNWSLQMKGIPVSICNYLQELMGRGFSNKVAHKDPLMQSKERKWKHALINVMGTEVHVSVWVLIYCDHSSG